jgi:hypothetical protein
LPGSMVQRRPPRSYSQRRAYKTPS